MNPAPVLNTSSDIHHPVRYTLQSLDSLFAELIKRGFTLIGPTIREGAIIYDEIEGENDLPRGWTDDQEGGHYRLEKREDSAMFGYALGPTSWKRFLYPPEVTLWKGSLTPDAFVVEENDSPVPNYVFIGVRACEMEAIRIQDRIFMGNGYQDPHYKKRREKALFIGLNCHVAGKTCFCVSMGSGPHLSSGYDIALTEVLRNGEPLYVAEIGSDSGTEMLTHLSVSPAPEDFDAIKKTQVEHVSQSQIRSIETQGLKELLYSNINHPQWEKVAERCLSCANCTMVCPTCFCSSVEDHTNLLGSETERVRVWDSCFSMDFTYLHGGQVRSSVKSRYRQWLTHKLASWEDQFGISGCVGCGRCITWCPVGIDITEEVKTIRNHNKNDHDGGLDHE